MKLTYPMIWVLTAALTAPAFALQEEPEEPEKPKSVPAIPLVQPAKAKQRGAVAVPLVRPANARAAGAAGSSGASYAALDEEFAAAYRAWMTDVNAQRDSANPAYVAPPQAEFYPRFRAVADSGNVDARLWCLSNFEHDATAAEYRPMVWRGEAVSLAVAARGNAELAKPLTVGLRAGMGIAGQDGIEDVFVLLERTATDEAVTRVAMSARAAMSYTSSDPQGLAKGMDIYAEIAARWPESTEGVRAAGKIFSAKHLALGKTPPDFVGQDVDGKDLRLSDYRGKVTLIDFWGFW